MQTCYYHPIKICGSAGNKVFNHVFARLPAKKTKKKGVLSPTWGAFCDITNGQIQGQLEKGSIHWKKMMDFLFSKGFTDFARDTLLLENPGKGSFYHEACDAQEITKKMSCWPQSRDPTVNCMHRSQETNANKGDFKKRSITESLVVVPTVCTYCVHPLCVTTHCEIQQPVPVVAPRNRKLNNSNWESSHSFLERRQQPVAPPLFDIFATLG